MTSRARESKAYVTLMAARARRNAPRNGGQGRTDIGTNRASRSDPVAPGRILPKTRSGKIHAPHPAQIAEARAGGQFWRHLDPGRSRRGRRWSSTPETRKTAYARDAALSSSDAAPRAAVAACCAAVGAKAEQNIVFLAFVVPALRSSAEVATAPPQETGPRTHRPSLRNRSGSLPGDTVFRRVVFSGIYLFPNISFYSQRRSGAASRKPAG